MRSIIIVEVFPSLQLRIWVNVIRVRQQLIKLGLIRSVGTFDFATQLMCLGFDVDLPHALICDMPVKTSLKFMTSIGPDRADPEGRLFNHVVQELDRTLLIVFWKDL